MGALSPMGVAALEYASQGFSVFPVYEIAQGGGCACGRSDCSNPGKHPRVRSGFKEASKDVETVSRWWREAPTANIGIATGAPSGVFVLDVDLKNNGPDEFERLQAEHGQLADNRRRTRRYYGLQRSHRRNRRHSRSRCRRPS